MADMIENYFKFEFHAVARFLQSERVNQNEIHRRSVFMDRKSSVERKCLWCSKFRDGRTALSDDPEKQRGRPRTSHTDEYYAIVEGLIRDDQTVKVRESHCKIQL
jgi:hypothetical protein